MIKSFRHAGRQSFFETGSRAGVRPEHAPKLGRLLGALDAAAVIDQMNVPGFRLLKLAGRLNGFWSVTVNGNWRAIFRFENGEAEQVDYH